MTIIACEPAKLIFNTYYRNNNSVWNKNSGTVRLEPLESSFIKLENCSNDENQTYKLTHIAVAYSNKTQYEREYFCTNFPILNVSYQDFIWINDYAYIKLQCNNTSLCLSKYIDTANNKCNNTQAILKFVVGQSFYNQLETYVDYSFNDFVGSFVQFIHQPLIDSFGLDHLALGVGQAYYVYNNGIEIEYVLPHLLNMAYVSYPVWSNINSIVSLPVDIFKSTDELFHACSFLANAHCLINSHKIIDCALPLGLNIVYMSSSIWSNIYEYVPGIAILFTAGAAATVYNHWPLGVVDHSVSDSIDT